MAFLSREVFLSRLESMRGFMDENKLDALAFLTPDYFFYATNYFLDVAPWERPVIAVLPRSGELFCVMHELSTNHVRLAKERGTLWVEDVTLYSEHPRVTNRTYVTPQWAELVAYQLRRCGLAEARIGVDSLGGPISQVPQYLNGSVQFVQLEKSMRDLRMQKHEEELELVRKGGLLSDFGQECFKANIQDGRVVQELDYTVAGQILKEAARRFPNEHVEVRIHTETGPDSAAPHGSGAPTGVCIQKGHGLVNVLIVRINGLVVENERTWFCGQPSDTQMKAFAAAKEAQEAAIEQLFTGNPLCNVDAAALSVFEKAGYGEYVIHRTGHGIGIAGHEFPDDMAFNPRPLRANEVYSAEPGIYIFGLGGFRHDDTVIVGDKPEVVTKAPKDLTSQIVL